MDTPRTFPELFDFYNDYVRLLYGRVQAQNALPQEILYEINAAFDHISRHWTHGHSEAEKVAKAFSHLKRSCLDIFKLAVKDTIDQYNELQRIDTSIIDNGTFDKRMHWLIADIKAKSVKARQADAETHDGCEAVFALWVEVYQMCEEFNQAYFLSPHVRWAKKKNRIYTTKAFMFSVVSSFVAGLLLFQPFWSFISKIKSFFAR
ncbi:MAG: hypothetical protein PHV28_05150 [Kiritimatiellae bacterium]|nr:hypothetical protein [Kiritimatiellia bacterium]